MAASLPPAWRDTSAVHHGIVAEVVDAVTECSKADPWFVHLHLLVALGVWLGRGPSVAGPAGRRAQRANLHALFIAPSGAGKGTAWHELDFLFEWGEGAFKLAVARKVESGQALIESICDPSLNAKGEVVREGKPDKRLLVVTEEFSALLKAGTRANATLLEELNTSWDSPWVLENRAIHSPLRATAPHVGVIGHITPLVLENAVAHAGAEIWGGFFNRFLFAYTQGHAAPTWSEAIENPLLGRFVTKLNLGIEAARKHQHWSLDPAARVYWMERHPEQLGGREVDLVAAEGGDRIAETWSRCYPLIIRLALIYAAVEGSDQIRAEHLQVAEAIWEYSCICSLYAFTRPTERVRELGVQLAVYCEEHPEGISRAEALRQWRGFKAYEFAQAVEGRGDLATVQSNGNRGRKAILYVHRKHVSTNGDH